MIEGMRVLEEYQARGVRLEELYATSEAAAELGAWGDVLRLVPERSLARLSSLVDAQGAIGVARRPTVALEQLRACEVVLAPAGLQDPGNLGTLVRSLVAFSRHAGLVLDASSVDVFGPKSVRAASGALALVAVAEVPDLGGAIETLAGLGFGSLGLVTRGGARPPWHAPAHFVLVVGAEGPGLDPRLAALCRGLLTIPMRAGMDSLNAGVAGSIALAWLWASRVGPSSDD